MKIMGEINFYLYQMEAGKKRVWNTWKTGRERKREQIKGERDGA